MSYTVVGPDSPLVRSIASPRIHELSWNAAMDGKLVLAVPSGAILDCNPAAEALLNVPRERLLGSWLVDRVPQEERGRVMTELAQL